MTLERSLKQTGKNLKMNTMKHTTMDLSVTNNLPIYPDGTDALFPRVHQRRQGAAASVPPTLLHHSYILHRSPHSLSSLRKLHTIVCPHCHLPSPIPTPPLTPFYSCSSFSPSYSFCIPGPLSPIPPPPPPSLLASIPASRRYKLFFCGNFITAKQ